MQPTELPRVPQPDLSRIAPLVGVSAEPEPETEREKEDLDTQRLQAELAGLRQDTAERKRYASRFYYLSCAWIVIITLILLLQGFGSFWFGKCPFKLSEAVVLAVIGSTTANVLGILFVVANYLFPKKGPADHS